MGRRGDEVARAEGDGVLLAVGAKVRALRESRGESRRALAAAAGLSERFLADLEGGAGNISLQRLARLARALGTSAAQLLSGAERGDRGVPADLSALLSGLTGGELAEAQRWLRARFSAGRGPLVALLGLRGAGKSTIGKKLAARLRLPFVELDALVSETAGLSLSGIFSLHGEAYYRRLAREVLVRFLAGADGAVLATGGSLVADRDAFELLLRRCRTVWLKASPEDHWRRVLEQGDERPSAASPQAQAELRALLRVREPLYAQAEIAVDTSRLGISAAVEEIARKLSAQAGNASVEDAGHRRPEKV